MSIVGGAQNRIVLNRAGVSIPARFLCIENVIFLKLLRLCIMSDTTAAVKTQLRLGVVALFAVSLDYAKVSAYFTRKKVTTLV